MQKPKLAISETIEFHNAVQAFVFDELKVRLEDFQFSKVTQELIEPNIWRVRYKNYEFIATKNADGVFNFHQ